MINMCKKAKNVPLRVDENRHYMYCHILLVKTSCLLQTPGSISLTDVSNIFKDIRDRLTDSCLC